MSKFEKAIAIFRLVQLLSEILDDGKITQKELDAVYAYLSDYVD